MSQETSSRANPSSPRRPRRLLRFSLASLLLLMIPLGFGFRELRNFLDNRPIPWIPYSAATLDQNLRDGRTVLVNFRATWDIAMVTHEPRALETDAVRRAIRHNGVVALRADYTDGSPEIKSALQSLNQIVIPVVAVYPAATPDKPIVLTGIITEKQVLEALALAANRR